MIKFILGLFGYVPVKKETYNAIRRVLKYSFDDIDYQYNGLTRIEKKLLTEEEFSNLINITKK
jgi:hypothetical protein